MFDSKIASPMYPIDPLDYLTFAMLANPVRFKTIVSTDMDPIDPSDICYAGKPYPFKAILRISMELRH